MDYGGDVGMKNKYHCWVLWRGYNHDIIISSLLKGKKNNSCISLLTCIGLERGGGEDSAYTRRKDR